MTTTEAFVDRAIRTQSWSQGMSQLKSFRRPEVDASNLIPCEENDELLAPFIAIDLRVATCRLRLLLAWWRAFVSGSSTADQLSVYAVHPASSLHAATCEVIDEFDPWNTIAEEHKVRCLCIPALLWRANKHYILLTILLAFLSSLHTETRS